LKRELLVTIDVGFEGWWSFLLKGIDEATDEFQ
jgi:hypothetical protein